MKKTKNPPENMEIPSARFTVYPLPKSDFFAGVECLNYGGQNFKLSLGGHSVRLFYEGQSFKCQIRFLDAAQCERKIQRNLGSKMIASALEGAVLFLRALNRGELEKIRNGYNE